jgi:hypothetical protein
MADAHKDTSSEAMANLRCCDDAADGRVSDSRWPDVTVMVGTPAWQRVALLTFLALVYAVALGFSFIVGPGS